MPSKLRKPDIIFRIDLRIPALRQRDFAIIAEPVFIDGQLVFEPTVVDMFGPAAAKAAAEIFLPDDGPAGKARLGINSRRILYAMQVTLHSV